MKYGIGLLWLLFAFACARAPRDGDSRPSDSTAQTTLGDAGHGEVRAQPPSVEEGDVPLPDAGDAGTDAALCYDETRIPAAPWAAPAAVNQGKCSGAQISSFLAACMAPGATAQTCDAFAATGQNAECLRCVVGGAPGDSPSFLATLPPPALVKIESALMPNTHACAAAVIGKPECGAPLTQSDACPAAVCLACDSSRMPVCVNAALSRPCARFTAVAVNCDGYTQLDTSWKLPCMGGPTWTNASTQTLIAKMCGP